MTMLLIDGFDHADVLDVWTSVSGGNVTTVNPRTGSRCMNGPTMYRALAAGSEADDGVTMGAAVYQDTGNVLPIYNLWQTFTEGTTGHIDVAFYPPNRSIRVYRGSLATGIWTLLAESAINLWTYLTWHYLESQVKIADSGGTVEVRLNGVTIINFTGDTRNGGTGIIDRVGFVSASSFAQTRLVDDVYILNEQGGFPWNGFLGDTRCYPSMPDGNGFYSQLLGSDGNSTNNYQLVDEIGTPSIADYVGSATDTDKDTYTFQDLPVSVGTIQAVEVRLHAAKTESGAKQIRPVVRRSSTDAYGADHILAEDSYSTFRDIFELDPHAGPGAWTISNFDASEFGAEVRP